PDPEESMTTADMIRHWGYTVETHEAITDDGYILSLLRIPHGRRTRGFISPCRRSPILFIHGLSTHAAEFVINPPESSPGMILAEAGFDVFLLSHRGTRYSQRHLNLTKDDPAFWKFTFDDFAKYDVPSAIDRVLKLNGASSLFYIGHSQGTLIGFLMLAEKPEYNSKVRALFQLAPIGTLKWGRGLSRF
ncbi:hypothetical protein PENTCL1PPCAC_14848, partial [Pristionchus entomophagus]